MKIHLSAVVWHSDICRIRVKAYDIYKTIHAMTLKFNKCKIKSVLKVRSGVGSPWCMGGDNDERCPARFLFLLVESNEFAAVTVKYISWREFFGKAPGGIVKLTPPGPSRIPPSVSNTPRAIPVFLRPQPPPYHVSYILCVSLLLRYYWWYLCKKLLNCQRIHPWCYWISLSNVNRVNQCIYFFIRLTDIYFYLTLWWCRGFL